MLKKENLSRKVVENSGFGTDVNTHAGRYINKDGKANVIKRGVSFLANRSWYHTLLNLPRWYFILMLTVFYFVINFVFAGVYFLIGTEYLMGSEAITPLEKFADCYFFSAQTFTTVGYGSLSPDSFLVNIIAAFEAFVGLLSFALATGVFFSRFSRPKAHILFSKNAVIAPYRGITAFMVRIAPHKNTNLSDAEAKMTLALTVFENGNKVNKFFKLDLEMTQVNTLTLSWTIVHPITEDSPLFGLKMDDYSTIEGEVIVHINAFDDMYSSQVATRSSFTFKEVLYGEKFVRMYDKEESEHATVLHISKINTTEKAVV